MQVMVSVNVGANETLTKTSSEIADVVLTAIGGDPEKDTVTVSVSATAGTGAVVPPAEPRTIG